VTELGLRYRPLATADQEDHQAGVLLLARDLDGADNDKLARAASDWVRTERFMPKASDLLGRMAKMVSNEEVIQRRRGWIERGNSLLAAEGRHGLQWVCNNGHYSIEPK
jgi:hypothetical protein